MTAEQYLSFDEDLRTCSFQDIEHWREELREIFCEIPSAKRCAEGSDDDEDDDMLPNKVVSKVSTNPSLSQMMYCDRG